MKRKAFLIVLDGWGHSDNPEVSAIAQANTPYVDGLYQHYPHAELTTFGEAVGLPEGQMGNSEVGHLNIGAGRIVYQELARINREIETRRIADRKAIREMIAYSHETGHPVHLLGLLSDGGVHSHIDHIIHVSHILSESGVKHFIHAFLDGRDTDPQAGEGFVRKLLDQTDPKWRTLSTVIGRYYAMDRDRRWDRIQKAWQLLVTGEGHLTDDIPGYISSCYKKGITDEFMEPIKYGDAGTGIIQKGDAVFFVNFRTDRPRQLTEALTQSDFTEQNMHALDLHFTTMTEYDARFEGINIVFSKEHIRNTLGEVISGAGLTQLRIAETEKYPHVTFFFSGGREHVFEGEKRILVDSPKVATYDQQPEMSAIEVTDRVLDAVTGSSPDLIVLNYANADMVGHTGVFKAAVKAVETLDQCLSRLVPVALEHHYAMVIIADHGNSDCMINPDGSPNTAHTINPVPIIVLDPQNKDLVVRDGKLADIAPTILSLMGIKPPEDMTGDIIAG